jgi:hypothetical protein
MRSVAKAQRRLLVPLLLSLGAVALSRAVLAAADERAAAAGARLRVAVGCLAMLVATPRAEQVRIDRGDRRALLIGMGIAAGEG